MGTVYGYARVSTREQNLDRQLDALARRGVDGALVFTDKATGADFERPGWRDLLGVLGEGDLLVVASVDRLGRDYDEIQRQWRRVTKEVRADVEVLDMPLLNTRGVIGGLTGVFLADIALQIMCYLAQMERDRIRERQREGYEAARARGQKLGPQFIEVPGNFEEVYASYLRKERTRRQCARELGVSPSTFDRWRRAYEAGDPRMLGAA